VNSSSQPRRNTGRLWVKRIASFPSILLSSTLTAICTLLLWRLQLFWVEKGSRVSDYFHQGHGIPIVCCKARVGDVKTGQMMASRNNWNKRSQNLLRELNLIWKYQLPALVLLLEDSPGLQECGTVCSASTGNQLGPKLLKNERTIKRKDNAKLIFCWPI
jgi:hypothetical protein